MDFLGIGWGEIFIVLVVALLVFGPGKIIQVARSLGKAVSVLKKAAGEFSTQVSREMDEQQARAQQEKLKHP
jgi:sec-independent protein translocase protein TatA